MNKQSKSNSHGFTLTEVLIAVVLTLILLGLMIRAFAISSSEIARGRAVLEMAGQLRSTSEQLRSDLEGATARMLPRNQIGNATGYFEYIEGPARDNLIYTDKSGNTDLSAAYGDIDDILMFTSRSMNQPFRGRWNGQIIESNFAEIIWWTAFEDANGNGQFDVREPIRLYRRVLLIRPDLVTAATDINEFQQFNDVSVRLDPNGNIQTNSLTDLTDRANRFARAGTPFPHEPNFALLQASNAFVLSSPTVAGTTNLSAGEDIMLSGIAAFDVRAFDPVVEIRQSADLTTALAPGDYGYAVGDITNIQYGGYVDLNVGAGNGIFTVPPGLPAPQNSAIIWSRPTYCTWCAGYESDGLNQDGDQDALDFDGDGNTTEPLIDEGINGWDDNGTDGADDVNEFETRPPYPYPLRGIRVTIRLLQPSTQVVRQTSVIADFVPE